MTTAPSAAEAREAHRLETLGRLSPGMAHELSTPAQFMGDTVSFLTSALEGYSRVLAAYEDLARDAGAILPDAVAKVRAVEKEVNLAYLTQRAPGALSRIEAGVRRIADTARSLSALSEPALAEGETADIQSCLERALTLLSANIRHVTVVKVSITAPIAVRMMPRDLADVLLNVLLNAIESVTAAGHRGKTGLIEVQAEAHDDAVILDVADNGVGILPAHQARIFDPTFSTKPGRRGRGLSIARDVLRSHDGSIELIPVSAGAHFRLTLPAAPRLRQAHGQGAA
jgi:C4-dicarboxylate-specific signal transduction histidine kinase